MAVIISAFLGALIGAFSHKAYASYQEAKNAAQREAQDIQWFRMSDQKGFLREQSTRWKTDWLKSLVSL